ncbi:hypothetical protein EV360DRAFT_78426 [Lentinula raphanica]|nr:hypothetical protein EV360DRAFT_78426 [Lentinula raphanica]
MPSDFDELETKFQTDIYLHLIAFTFLCYDHLLTFDTEVRLIWTRPNTLSSYLFFLNRYFSLIGNVFIILSIFFSSEYVVGHPILVLVSHLLAYSCSAWNIVQELFHALVGVMIAALLTLRIYALYGCNKRLLMFLSSLIFIGIVVAIITDLLASSTPIPSSIPNAGCHDILALKDAALVAVGWEALLVYDILLFGMTLAKAYQARGQMGSQHSRGMSLISVIIKDGTIYFAIMTLVNFVNVFTFYVTGNTLLRAAFSPITSCLSVTIMSRLMLHLHEIGTQGLYADHAKTMRPFDVDTEEHGMIFTTLWSDSDPSSTGSSGMGGGLSAFEQGSSSGYRSPTMIEPNN